MQTQTANFWILLIYLQKINKILLFAVRVEKMSINLILYWLIYSEWFGIRHQKLHLTNSISSEVTSLGSHVNNHDMKLFHSPLCTLMSKFMKITSFSIPLVFSPVRLTPASYPSCSTIAFANSLTQIVNHVRPTKATPMNSKSRIEKDNTTMFSISQCVTETKETFHCCKRMNTRSH